MRFNNSAVAAESEALAPLPSFEWSENMLHLP
jgi:hypothetical protein